MQPSLTTSNALKNVAFILACFPYKQWEPNESHNLVWTPALMARLGLPNGLRQYVSDQCLRQSCRTAYEIQAKSLPLDLLDGFFCQANTKHVKGNLVHAAIDRRWQHRSPGLATKSRCQARSDLHSFPFLPANMPRKSNCQVVQSQLNLGDTS